MARQIDNTERRIERIWTNVGDLRIHALAVRNAALAGKTPIVLLPGLGMSVRYLIPAMRELAASREVFAPEFPGWGDSSKPWHAFNIRELAEFLARWMESERIKRADLVGHSLGGQIAAEFALRYPNLIQKTVLASTTFEQGKRSFFCQFGRFLRNAPREPWRLVLIALQDYFKFGTRREILTLRYSLKDKIEEKLPLIYAPTLVLRGELDSIVTQNWAETMKDLLPNGKLAVISGGTHGVIYQSHRKFARSVSEFLDS